MDENENENNDAPEFRGRCEDAPCCGCCGQVEFASDPEMDDMRDFEIGDCWRGNDEEGCDDDDEEPCEEGGEDRHLDSFWESQTECFGMD